MYCGCKIKQELCDYFIQSFNMCVDLRNLMQTVMLLFLSGALCIGYKVEYHQQKICAVKGSSAVIQCSFYHPDKEVQSVMWGHDRYNIYSGPFIYDSKENITSARFEYIGDIQHNCSLKIHQVEHNDAGKYAFRFKTNKDGFTGAHGSTLKVVDLNVKVTKSNVNGTRKEGDSVNLTCMNDCEGAHRSSAFSWYKNGEPINDGAVLYLSNISSEDSGNYTCSLKMHTGTTSGVINIDVEYGPKNTSVSVRPSTEVDAGSNITLICSSHANPPVENYTWFKIDDDDDDILAVGHRPVFCSADGGQYLCRATNKHGHQNSSVVTIRIREYWEPFNRDALIISIVAVLLIVTVTVIVVRRLKKKRTRAPETNCEENIQNTVYANWPVFDNNQSRDRSWCEDATLGVNYATLDIHTRRKSDMERQKDSSHDDEGVIYSTVCRHSSRNETR